jgi:hypothetical protein
MFPPSSTLKRTRTNPSFSSDLRCIIPGYKWSPTQNQLAVEHVKSRLEYLRIATGVQRAASHKEVSARNLAGPPSRPWNIPPPGHPQLPILVCQWTGIPHNFAARANVSKHNNTYRWPVASCAQFWDKIHVNMIGYALQTKKSNCDLLLSYHWKIFKIKSCLFDTLWQYDKGCLYQAT